MKKIFYAILLVGMALHNLNIQSGTALVDLNGKTNDFIKNKNTVTHAVKTSSYGLSANLYLFGGHDCSNNTYTDTYSIATKGKLLGYEKSIVNCVTCKEIRDLLIESEKAGFMQSVISGTALIPIFSQDYYTTANGKKIRSIKSSCVNIFDGNQARYSYELLTPVYGTKHKN